MTPYKYIMSNKYNNTVIYKIVCKDHKIESLYVGHTVSFNSRKQQHKRTYEANKFNYKVYDFIRNNGGWNNWEMIEIEKYPCNDVNEAKARERFYYESLNADLNKTIPIVFEDEKIHHKKESDKAYSEANKEKIKIQRK